jgi:hypothetical protein
MTWKITVMSYAVHLDDDSPIFGETATHVRLADEGAGPYLVLSQANNPHAVVGEISVMLDELEQVLICARKLTAGVE